MLCTLIRIKINNEDSLTSLFHSSNRHDTVTLAKCLVDWQEKTVKLKSMSNKSFLLFYFTISRKEVNLPAMYSKNLCICANYALQFFTHGYLIATTNTSNPATYLAREKHLKIVQIVKGETAVQALCDLLSQSKNL